MSDNIKELVKRLRDPYRVGKGNFDVMVAEAADALEALEINRDLWRDKCAPSESTIEKVVSDLAALAEEVERISNTLYLVASRP